MVRSKKVDVQSELLEQKNEIDDMNYKLTKLKEAILDKYPRHFSIRNIVDSLFSALLIGLTFILKGATVPTAASLGVVHVVIFLVFTLLIIFMQVYFVSYSRVKHRAETPPIPYIAKRMIAIIMVSFVVSISLVYMLAINTRVESVCEGWKVILLLTSICAMGSAIPGLILKY